MNNMRTKVLTAHVPSLAGQEEERGRLTLESLADVDAGLVIDHQDVKAWAGSLDTDAIGVPGKWRHGGVTDSG